MRRRSDLVRDLFLLVLAACGGALDATAYLRLHAFTANMTGNTVILGLALGGRHLENAYHSAVAIGAFAVGAFLATAIGSEATDEDPWPAAVIRPFALEIVLLAAFAACWRAAPRPSDEIVLLLALGAAAMGVQSGITHDIHLSGASTTYMTGTIARTAEAFADMLKFGFRGSFVLNGVAWIVYLVAAVLVATLDLSRHLGPLLWGITAVVALVGVTGRRFVMRARGTEKKVG